jgi:ATP-dependent Lhr-like helicase
MMGKIEIVQVPAVKDMELSVERPVPKKGDKEIAEKVTTTLTSATKLRRMAELVEKHKATLIFVNTRQMAETLASRFRILSINSDIHHSSLSKEAREAVEEDFKTGRLKALICTSSLELGIDIGSVDLVIQYNSPRQVTRLVQRVGRSGHKIRERSKGIIIADSSDDIFESLVIIRRALSDELEPISVFEKPYDVLCHQIVGLALDFGELKRDKCYSILKKTRVFRKLGRNEFEEALKTLRELRLIWLTDDMIQKGRLSRKYYYENISTIPDEKKYFVRNTVTRENVGVLDEAFVAGLEYGDLIIFKGMPWHVISAEEGEVFLEPVSVVSGEVPRWVGEEIPVEYAVAREAGSLRNRRFKGYSADNYTKRLALAPVKRQKKQNLTVPDHTHMVVELFSDFIVVHSTFGLKVNQTLGRVFSTLLSARSGHSVNLKVDAYRIVLQARSIGIERVVELFKTDPTFIEPLLSSSLKRTSIYKWKFVHTAKRFGAISKNVDFKGLGLARVIKAWEDSLIHEETLKDIFTSNLDIKNSEKVLEAVKSGKIQLDILRLKQPSPISEVGMEAFSEVVLPQRAERMILRALKNRIQSRRVTLFCAYCGKWHESFYVKNIPEDVKCGVCEAKMLAPLTFDPQRSIKAFKKYKTKKSLSNEEKKDVKKIQHLGGLYLSYGRLLAEALAARGIGPEIAKRVLRDSRTEEELYRNILKSERNYARTKRFWD